MAFIDKQAANNGNAPNHSGYIKDILSQHRHAVLKAQMIAALIEETSDPEYLKEIALWDCVALDGID